MPPRSRASLITFLAALTTAVTVAGCSGQADPAAPTTAKQLNARMVTTAQLPDGIKAAVVPNILYEQPAPGPPFTRASCESLQLQATFLSFGTQPVLSGHSLLAKELAAPVRLGTAVWQAAEAVYVYQHATAARLAMTSLAKTGKRCSASIQAGRVDGVAGHTREHVRRLAGMGDQALDVQVRTVSPGRAVLASDWIAIQSGRCVLVLYEMPTAGTATTRYLQATARAAWHVYDVRR